MVEDLFFLSLPMTNYFALGFFLSAQFSLLRYIYYAIYFLFIDILRYKNQVWIRFLFFNGGVAIAYMIALRGSWKGGFGVVSICYYFTDSLLLWQESVFRYYDGFFNWLNTACMIANCLQPWLAKYFILKYTHYRDIFAHLSSALVFIIVSIFSPIASAILGVTGLLIVNALDISEYPVSFITWWFASALAHILFSPPILIAREKDVLCQRASYREIFSILVILIFICIIIFRFAYPLEYLLLPIIIWGVFRLNRRNSSLLVSLISFVAITATGRGYGIFVKDSANESLLLLQFFTAMLSLTALILSAVLSERQMAQQSLKETLENLEVQVFERTR